VAFFLKYGIIEGYIGHRVGFSGREALNNNMVEIAFYVK
jgi:hypothetical protein